MATLLFGLWILVLGSESDEADTSSTTAEVLSVPVQIENAPRTHLERAVVNRQPTISILALDTDGRPVPNLRLGIFSADFPALYDLERPPIEKDIGTTNPLGILAIPASIKEGSTLISLDSDWLVVNQSITSTLQGKVLHLRLRRGGSVHGIIVGENGPVEGAIVGAHVTTEFLKLFGNDAELAGPLPSVFDPVNSRYTTTDIKGRFSIGGLVASSKRLDILAQGYAPLRHDFQGPHHGENLNLGILHLNRGIDVIFHVSSSTPIQLGSRLFLKSKDSVYTRGSYGKTLDEEGNLAVANMLPGAYSWSVQRPDSLATGGVVQVPESGGTIALPIPGQRKVSVQIRATNGLAIADFEIHAKEPKGQTSLFYCTNRSLGESDISCSEGQSFRLRVEAPGYALSPSILVPASDSTCEIRLKKLGQLELELLGLENKSKLRVGIVHEMKLGERLMLQLGSSPTPMQAPFITDYTLLLENLKPGETWVILDLGSGPSAYGPYRVAEAERTVDTISLPEPRTFIGFIHDSKSGAALTNVAVHRAGTGNSEFASLFRLLSPHAPPATISDADGRFEISLAANESCNLFLKHSHYASNTFAIPPSQATHRFDLTALPATTLQVSFSPQHPAANASVSFLRRAQKSLVPQPLGQVKVDVQGHATLDVIPEGQCEAFVQAELEPGLRYHIRFSNLMIRAGEPVELSILNNPGWISLPTSWDIPPERIVLSQDSPFDALPSKIICEQKWLVDSPTSIAVAPGEYRIHRTQLGQESVTTCTVRAGETVRVEWENRLGQILVHVTGTDWTASHLRLKLLDGNLAGFYRDLHLEHQAGPHRIDHLPKGKYEISLNQWDRRDGSIMFPKWSKTVNIGSSASIVSFPLSNLSSTRIETLDRYGNLLEDVVLRCEAHSDIDGKSVIKGVSGQDGQVDLLLPSGTLSIKAFLEGYQLATVELSNHQPGGDFRIVLTEAN